jgi:hypothetical protein
VAAARERADRETIVSTLARHAGEIGHAAGSREFANRADRDEVRRSAVRRALANEPWLQNPAEPRRTQNEPRRTL